MAEYISREAAIANSREYNLGGSYDNTELAVPVDTINSIHAADVRPVVRGKWIGYKADDPGWLRDDGTPVFITCDQCGAFVMNNVSAQWNYCPNCGADMREES